MIMGLNNEAKEHLLQAREAIVPLEAQAKIELIDRLIAEIEG
ncbi:MAG: hypothetical protein HW403_460 [Dehalococcoidia bacterium]|nr:hypothetical protein [Dehalococcoidia bacterium]